MGQIGVQLPGVELLQPLNSSATAYLARVDAEDCVIHCLNGDAEPQELLRFRRQLATRARLSNPLLARVIDSCTAGKYLYVAYELVKGEQFLKRQKRQPFEESELFKLVIELCVQLRRLHQQGLSHGQLKQNSLVIDPSTLRLRLTDFDSPGESAAHGTTTPTQIEHGGTPEDDVEQLLELLDTHFAKAPRLRLNLPTRCLHLGVSDVARIILGNCDEDDEARQQLLQRFLLDAEATTAEERLVDSRAEVASSITALLLTPEPQTKRVAVVMGEAGSGKSRLVRELNARATTNACSTLLCRCQLWDPRPFSLARTIAEKLLVTSGWGQRDVERAGQGVASILKVLSPKLEKLFGDAPAVPDSEDTQHIYVEGLTEFFARAFNDRDHCLVYIDDIHGIDHASAMILKRLVGRTHGNVRFLLSGRPGIPSQRLFAALPKKVTAFYRLEPLTASDCSQLIQDYLGPKTLRAVDQLSLAQLGDGSPLVTLEVVRSVLDDGALRPTRERWVLASEQIARVQFPKAIKGILTLRIRQLQESTVEVLSAAAVIGNEFKIRQLEVLLRRDNVSNILKEGEESLLLRKLAADTYCFVHDCVRETLVAHLSVKATRELHLQIARSTLDDSSCIEISDLSADTLYQLAMHAGQARDLDPELCYITNLEAGRRALDAFDNAQALEFLLRAESAAQQCTQVPSAANLQLYIAEAELRRGHAAASLERLAAAEAVEQNPLRRASILNRLAWVHEGRSDTENVELHLQKAMDLLGIQMPRMNARSIWRLMQLMRKTPTLPSEPRTALDEHKHYDVLAGLYYMCCRLGLNTDNPGLLLAAVAASTDNALKLGPSPALARAYGFCGLAAVSIGRRALAEDYMNRAREVAVMIGNPVSLAHCLVAEAGLLAWVGDFRAALVAGELCINQHGRWLELGDYVLTGINQVALETVRGRGLHAWATIEKMLEKVAHHEGDATLPEFLYLQTEGVASYLGKVAQNADKIQLARSVCRTVPKKSGIYFQGFGGRVRKYTETGNLGSEFEALVAEVQQAKLDPKRVHLAVIEYYLHVAHARVHECLQAHPSQLPQILPKLKRAANDLRRGARISILKAHANSIDGYVAFFQGKFNKAAHLFYKAEKGVEKDGVPWVLYAVARGRAHILKYKGCQDAAMEQARIAAALSSEHGAAHRMAWILTEFRVDSQDAGSVVRNLTSDKPFSPDETSREQRHLRALMGVGKASQHELNPEHQARVVLDEMIAALGAARGFLLLRDYSKQPLLTPPRLGELTWVAGRDHQGMNLPESSDICQEALSSALSRRDVQLMRQKRPQGFPPRSVIATPLLIREQVVGAVLLDSPAMKNTFDKDDGELLRALAGQVPVALELANALRDRERLEGDLRQAQKMEAVGRLAGGIAHDFNNMLAAINVSVESVLSATNLPPATREDLLTIRGAGERATKLTRQLLTFSRRQVLEARPVDLNEVVRELVPMLKRLLGSSITISHTLDPKLGAVVTDHGQLEQALVNLAVNARDAMPQGGSLTLSTRSGLGFAKTRTDAPRETQGETAYASVSITDTGHGMDRSTKERAFEPFFTTKGQEAGTGLGLAMVYGFVTQSGGHVEVESALGKGTTVALYFPESKAAMVSTPPEALKEESLRGTERILLVEDEPLVRQALSRVLRRLGYQVHAVSGGAEGLASFDFTQQVDLVITDLMMPGMNGIEFIQALEQKGVRSKVLYISGYATDVSPNSTTLGDKVDFLPKPTAHMELARRVRELLDNAADVNSVVG